MESLNTNLADDLNSTLWKPTILSNPKLMYFAAACIVVFIIVGVLGNLLTIVTLVRCPKLRSATGAFIVSLSVADFLFCAINLPFSASRFINQTWIHGDTLCIIFPFLRYGNVGLSLLSITAITLNRYTLIVHPKLYNRIYQTKYIMIMILFIWLFSFGILMPTMLGVWGRFGYDPKILNCSILETNGRSSKTFLFVFGFLLPCIAIIVSYARIYWTVKRSQRRLEVKRTPTGKNKNHLQLDPGFKSTRSAFDLKRRKEDWRLTRMVLVIFCSFVVCYLPITIVKVTDKTVQYPAVHIFGYIFIFMSACINPIIYGLTNKQYRKAYKSTLLDMKMTSTGTTQDSRCGSKPVVLIQSFGPMSRTSYKPSESSLEIERIHKVPSI